MGNAQGNYVFWKNQGTRQICEFLMMPNMGLSSGKIPDGIFLQAGLAVFAFRGLRTLKQKHRCAFQSLTRAKQFIRLLPN